MQEHCAICFIGLEKWRMVRHLTLDAGFLSHFLERQLNFSQGRPQVWIKVAARCFSWSQGQHHREDCGKCIRCFHRAVYQEEVWRRQVQLGDSSVSDWGPVGSSSYERWSTRRTSSSNHGRWTFRTRGPASSGSTTKAKDFEKALHHQERFGEVWIHSWMPSLWWSPNWKEEHRSSSHSTVPWQDWRVPEAGGRQSSCCEIWGTPRRRGNRIASNGWSISSKDTLWLSKR